MMAEMTQGPFENYLESLEQEESQVLQKIYWELIQMMTNDSEVANIFNNFFANVATKLKEPYKVSDIQ